MVPTVSQVEARLPSYLASRFPSRSGLHITGVADITTGWETRVFDFTLAYIQDNRPRQERLILRLYPSGDKAAKADHEFTFLERLYNLRYPVPAPALLETTGSPFGAPFIIMEYIDGRPLGQTMEASPEPQAQELLTLFCRLYVELHSLDWRSFAGDHIRYNPDDVIERQLTTTQQEIDHLGMYQFRPVLDWLWRRSTNVKPRHIAVVHGDYHPANLLLRPDGSAVVIDWAGGGVSDYRFDLSWTVLLMSTYGEATMRERVLRTYEALAGHSVEDLEFFEVHAMLRRLFAASVSATGKAGALGMAPVAQAMIGHHIENVRRVHALLRERTGIRIPQVEELVASLPPAGARREPA